MFNLEAKSLLLSLYSRINLQSPIGPQLTSLFTVSIGFSNSRVIPTNTLRGKISLFFNRNKNQEILSKQIHLTFSRAIQCLNESPKDLSEIPVPLQSALTRYLAEKKLLAAEVELKEDFPETKELKALSAVCGEADKAQKEKEEKELEQAIRISFLRGITSKEMSALDSQQLFRLSTIRTYFKEFEECFVRFLKQHPEYSVKDLDERLALVRNGRAYSRSLMEHCFPDSRTLDEKERGEALHQVAIHMATAVHSLKPGTEWMFCGGYGKPLSLSTVNKVAGYIPEEISEDIPPELQSKIKSLFSSGKLSNPETFVSDLIRKGFQDIRQMTPLDVIPGDIHQLLIGTLLPNQSREMTGRLAALMPCSVKRGIESWLKQGLIGNVMEFVDDSNGRDFILWAAEKAGEYTENPEAFGKKFATEMEQKIASYTQPVTEALTSIGEGIHEYVRKIPKVIPPALGHLFGVNSLFESGEFWIRFNSIGGNKFNLFLYANGSAVRCKPHSPQAESAVVIWPIQLTNVPAELLTPLFFKRLLEHYIEPKCDSRFVSRAEDLYANVVEYLKGTTESAEPHAFKQVDHTDLSPSYLFQLFTTNPQLPPEVAVFDMHCEALTAFCQPFLKGENRILTIDTLSDCQKFEKILSLLKNEFEALQSLFTERKVQSIKAAIQEIEIAIQRFRKREIRPKVTTLPKALLNAIRENGTSADAIKLIHSHKETLAWAFGDDLKDLIEVIANAVNSSEPTTRPSPSMPARRRTYKGWLRTILFNGYVRLALNALNIVHLMIRVYTVGIGYLMHPLAGVGNLLTSSCLFPRIIPTSVREWYASVVGELTRKFTNVVILLILRYLFSPTEAENLKLLFRRYRKEIGIWSKALSGKGVISYELSFPLTTPERVPFLSFSGFEEERQKLRREDGEIGHLFPEFLTRPELEGRKKGFDETAEKILADIIHQSKLTYSSEESYHYILSQVSILEIPERDARSVWDTVRNPEKCLEILSDISVEISKTALSSHNQAEFGELLIGVYTILAIMDRLARRCPETQLGRFKINAYPLMQQIKNGMRSQIDDPVLLERLKRICRYLMPEIDLDHIPSGKELERMAWISLFDYSYMHTYLKDMGITPEFLLFKKFLTPDRIKKIREKLNIPEGLGGENIFVLFLIGNSHTHSEDLSLLPKALILLKFQTMLCTHICNSPSRVGTYRMHVKENWNPQQLKKACSYIITHEKRAFLEVLTSPQPFKAKVGILTDKLSTAVSEWGPFQWLDRIFPYDSTLMRAYDRTFDDPRVDPSESATQSELVSSQQTLLSTREFDLSLCEPSERVIRLIEFLGLYPDSWQVHFKHLHEHLFLNTKLIKPLMSSAHVTTAIGEALKKALERTFLIRNHYSYLHILSLGIKLKKFCQFYSPRFLSAFPDFREEIRNALPHIESAHRTSLILLYTETIEQDYAIVDESERYSCVVVLATAFFLLKGIETNDFVHPSKVVIKYFQWLPAIKAILNNPILRRKLLSELFKALEKPLSGVDGMVWTKDIDNPALAFRSGAILVNFGRGNIVQGDSQTGIVHRFAHIIKRYCNPETLSSIDGDYLSQDKDFYFVHYVHFPDSTNPLPTESLRVFRVLEDKYYRQLPEQANLTPLFRQLTAQLDKTKVKYWLQDTSNPVKELLCYEDGVLKARFKVIKGEEHGVYDFLSSTTEQQPSSRALEQLQLIPSSAVYSGLLPLLQFCSISDLQCWTTPLGDTIRSIRIPQYALTFNIQNIDGELCASSDEFPGYVIERSQHHSLTSQFSSALLLINSNKERRVLIPKGNWILDTFWKHFSFLGPIVHMLKHYVQNISKSKHPTSYYVYDLDEETGTLKSEDPEALAFLITIYLLRGDDKSAHAACTAFELLCKRKSVSEEVLYAMLPILIPDGVKNLRYFRQRILAVIEENQLIHGPVGEHFAKKKNKSPDSGKKMEEAIHIVTILIIFYDLAYPSKNPQHRLSDSQEWFLFKRLIRSLRKLYDSKTFIPKKRSSDLIKKLGFDNAIECIAFHGSIGLRYRHLKKKFGERESLALRATRFVSRTLLESSSIPSLGFAPSIETSSSSILTTLKKLELELNYSRGFVEEGDLADKVLVDVQERISLTAATKESFIRDFFTYYAIAVGENGELKKALIQFLHAIKGGWDPRTAVLVKYLEMACLVPLFWTPSQIKKDVVENYRIQNLKPSVPPSRFFYVAELTQLFDHIHSRFMNCEYVSHGLQVLGGFTVDTVLPSYAVRQMTEVAMGQLAIGAVGGFILPAAHLVSKAATTYAKLSMTVATEREVIPALEVSLIQLEETNRHIDHHLAHIFSMLFTEYHFKERKEKDEKAEAATFPLVSRGTALQRMRLDRVIQSVKDYEQRTDRDLTCLRPKPLRSIWIAQGYFARFREKMVEQFQKERMVLLKFVDLFKYSNSDLADCEVDIRMLHFCFLHNDYSPLLEIRNIPKSQIAQLHIGIAKDLLNMIRFHQIERIKEKLFALDPSQEDYEQTLDQLATELKATMAFDFSTLDPKLLRYFMLFQAYTHTMLWKKQAHALIRSLVTEKGDVLIELLMSFGKTFFGVPTIDAYSADGSVIVFNAWVPGMFGTNTRQISHQSKQVYDQTAHALIWRRNIPLTTENLSALMVLFKTALERGETINIEKESAQALELVFIEKLYIALNKKKALSPEEELEITLLSDILLTMLTTGKLVGDEIHELLASRQELNHPLGPKRALAKNFCEIIEASFRFIVSFPAVKKLLKEGNKAKHLVTVFKEIVAPELAHHMSQYWKFGIKESQRKSFIDFVTGRTKVIPPDLQKNKHYPEICLLKGLTTTIFPLVFSQDPKVMFGFSKGARTKTAIPYDANESSLESASLKSPFVCLVKTMYMFFHLEEGLSKKEATDVLQLLYDKMEKEVEKRKTPPSTTKAYKFFHRMVNGHFTLNDFKTWSKERREAVLKEISNSEAGIFFYMRHFVWKDVNYWELNCCSTAQNFASMFGHLIADTGTPYNEGAMPDKLKLLLDPGTAGEVLHILSKKCPPDGIHILRQSSAREVLDEVLHTFFQMGSNFRAIIDGGPLFQGLDNLTVVRQMATFVRRCRPDILAIDFFMRDENQVDQIMSLVIVSGEIIPHERCRVKLATRLCYFDQKHGFAANIRIKYDGVGLHLIGRNHKFYRLSQESFRLRQLKTFKRIINEEMEKAEWEKLNLFHTSTIHFAMTVEVQKEISPRPIPSLQEIIEYSIKNEADEADNNQIDYYKKLADITRSQVRLKILLERNVQAKLALFKKGQGHFITTNQCDPVALFGYIEEPVPTEIALKAVRAKEIRLAAQTGLFSRDELGKITGAIEGTKVHPMPETTLVRIDKTGSIDISQVDFDAVQNVDVNDDEDAERDEDLNLNLDTQRACTLATKKHKFTEWGWTKALNPRSLDWLTFESAAGTSSLTSIVVSLVFDLGKSLSAKPDYGIPPLFKISDLLFQSTNPVLRKIAGLFHARIWATNNFIPTVLTTPDEDQVSVASREQRDLKEILIHFEEMGKEFRIISAGCLSFNETAIWREMIASGLAAEKKEGEAKEKETKMVKAMAPKVKVILYNVPMRIPIAGDEVDLAAFRKSREVLVIETALKILNGDVSFHPDQEKILEELVKLDGVIPAIHAIHTQRGKVPLIGTELEYVVSAAEGIPLEEQLD